MALWREKVQQIQSTSFVIMEQVLEEQIGVCVCYVDYIKAFDKVRYEEIITELTQLEIDGKDQRVIKKTCTRIDRSNSIDWEIN